MTLYGASYRKGNCSGKMTMTHSNSLEIGDISFPSDRSLFSFPFSGKRKKSGTSLNSEISRFKIKDSGACPDFMMGKRDAIPSRAAVYLICQLGMKDGRLILLN